MTRKRYRSGWSAGLFVVVFAAAIHSDCAVAAGARSTIRVDVQVTDNCAALLSSSTTSLAATSACRNSSVATTLSPTISSTSLSTLAPMVLLSKAVDAIGPVATAGAATGGSAPAKGSVTQQFNSLEGALSGGSVASQFIVSAADRDGQVIMITY